MAATSRAHASTVVAFYPTGTGMTVESTQLKLVNALTNVKRAIRRPIQTWFKAAKKALITHTLAAIAIVVFAVSEIFGIQGQARELLGVQHGREYSLLTHGIVHADWCHLVGNVLALEVFGPFVEKWLGKLLYVLAMPVVAITGAHLTLEMVPEYWDTNDNPVGMSIVTAALGATGLYLGTRNVILITSHQIVRLARNARREAASWAAVAGTAVIVTVVLWAESHTTVGPTKIGHTTGAVMGLMFALINAIIRTFRCGE